MCRAGRLTAATLLVLLAVIDGNVIRAAPPEARKDNAPDFPALFQRIETLRQQGEYGRAVDAARAVLKQAESTLPQADRRLTDARRALAAALLAIDDRAAAAPLLRQALATLERIEPQDASGLSSVVGDLASTASDATEAEALYRRALELAEQAHGTEHAATSLVLNNLGVFLRGQGRAEEAEAAMRRAVHIRERTEGMEGALTTQSLCTLGAIAADRGDMSIADSLVRASLERRRLTLPKGHPGIAESCLELARIQLFFGKERAQESTKLAAEAFDTYRRVYGPTHEWTLLAMHMKADGLAALGRQTESDQLHLEIIAAIERLPEPRTDMLADMLRDYGRHMLMARKPARAVELCRRALALQPKTRPPTDSRVIATRQVLAESLHDLAKGDEAVRTGREILAALDQAGSESAGDAGVARIALARYLLATGGMDEARGLLRQAVRQLDGAVGRGSRQSLQAIHLLAMTHVVTDELAEAERLVDDGLQRVAEAADGRTHQAAGELIALQGVIYRKTGRIKEAERAEAVGREIRGPERR